jgi:glycosyltransferase involved in cell wall biosynthesis
MKVSIITINYNHLAGLQRTMASVFAQTATDYEYIVIDGGSTDGSAEAVAAHADRLAYAVSEPDGGIFPAMNKGIAVARGEYCLFMNSGDTFHAPDVLQQVLPRLRGGDFYIGDQQETGGRRRRAPEYVTAGMLAYKYLPHQSAFIRTALLKARPYCVTCGLVADWRQMFEEMVLHDAGYEHLDLVVADFEVTGVSHNPASAQQMEASRQQTLRELLSRAVAAELRGYDAFDRRVRRALAKENALQRDLKILRNVLKQLPRDMWRAVCGGDALSHPQE